MGLLGKQSPESKSDAEYVVHCLQQLGYYTVVCQIEAECFGSCAVRLRLYFLAWLVSPELQLTKEDDLKKMLGANFKDISQLLDHICIGSLDTSAFIATDIDLLVEHTESVQEEEERNKVAKKDTNWQHEHTEAFREQGFSWPPTFDDASQVCGDGFELMTKGLAHERQKELLFFVNMVFPYNRYVDAIEFVDVNPSLGRLLGPERKSPWRATAYTITGQSALCIRYLTAEGLLLIRPLTGIETFQLIGCDFAFIQRPIVATAGLLSNMAGNAFSGFACMPALMVLFSGLGALRNDGIDACVQDLTLRAAHVTEVGSDVDSD